MQTTENASTNPPPVLSIIIPAYGQAEVTASCLASLQAFPPTVPWEIIIVDDASIPPLSSSLAQFSSAAVPLSFIRNEVNRGFAVSCNTGARAARGTCLLLLNNDTEALAGWWPPLWKALESSSHIGIVTPKLIFPDGTIQHCGKVWKDVTVPNAQAHHIYYKTPADAPWVNRSRPYTVVSGACILVRTDEFLAIGGFDEHYENGWEDDDLCYAYAKRGQQAFYAADSTLIHHQSTTLNREIVSLQIALPDQEALDRLGEAMRHNSATTDQIRTAQTVQATMQQLEAKLQQVRQRFHHNRHYFFSKWANDVRRDDYRYYREDGFATDPDYVRLDPSLQQLLGSPFELDPSVAAAQQGMVSIVILTWNQLEYTKECLRSIQANTPQLHEIIFVDNGSHDGTVPWLQEQVAQNRQYRLIANQQNRGFAAGCNQGITAAHGDYILLLNNDVVVTREWLSGLVECLESSPVSGIIGPVTNNISGMQQVRAVGYTALDGLESYAAAYRTEHRHRRIPSRRIVGFCMLFRRELVSRIGLLDERFGSGNFEDDDYCVRAALEGCTNMIAGDVFIHHYGSASFTGNKVNFSNAISGNMQLYTEKWSRPITDEQLARKVHLLKVRETAERLFQRFEVDSAVNTLLQEGIRHFPQEAWLYLLLAEFLYDAERYSDAIAVLREQPPESASITSNCLLGRCLTHLNRLPEAAELASHLPVNGAEACRVHLLKGIIAQEQQEWAGAAHHFRQAIVANPGDGEAYTYLGLLESRQGNQGTGLDLLERGFLLSPQRQLTRTAYHTASSTTGTISRAVPVFEDVLAFYPEAKGVQFYLIDLLIHGGMADRAMSHIEDALVKFGSSAALIAAAQPIRAILGPLVVQANATAAVSLCMIVKNEEAHLPRCLASLKPLVAEMIVVDTGSADQTKEIASLFGARVYDFPWNGDFSAARNESLAHANGTWILVMDADEVIAPIDHPGIRELLSTLDAPCAFALETRNYTDKVSTENWRPNDGAYPEQEAAGGWFPSTKIRLFPNHRQIRFQQPIHELVDYAVQEQQLQCYDLPVPIHHYGHLDTERQRHKQEQYFELGWRKLAAAGDDDLKAKTELAVQAAELGRYDQAIDLWQQVIARTPDFPLAHFNIGYAFLQTGRFAAALSAAHKALALNADYADAAINGAIAALCLGKDNEAQRLLDLVTGDGRHKAHFQLTTGVLHLCSGRTTEGIALLTGLRERGLQLNGFLTSMLAKLVQAGADDRAQVLRDAVRAAGCMGEELR